MTITLELDIGATVRIKGGPAIDGTIMAVSIDHHGFQRYFVVWFGTNGDANTAWTYSRDLEVVINP